MNQHNWVTFPESGNITAVCAASKHQAWRLFFISTNKPTATILSFPFPKAARLPATTFIQSRTDSDQPVSKKQDFHSFPKSG